MLHVASVAVVCALVILHGVVVCGVVRCGVLVCLLVMWCVCASVESHIGGLRVSVPLAVTALEAVGAFKLAVLSVEPGHWHPLRGGVHPFDGRLQSRNRLADVVVHNGQVEEMAVQLPQHVRLLGQPLQAAIVLQ